LSALICHGFAIILSASGVLKVQGVWHDTDYALEEDQVLDKILESYQRFMNTDDHTSKL
jgi:hypothetical protein